VNGSALGATATVVTLTADSGNPDVSQSTMNAAPSEILADNLESTVLTFSLKDRNGNLVSGQNITFSTSLPGSTLSSVTDNGDGTYSATLSSTWAGTVDISVYLGGTSFHVYTGSVKVKPVPVDLTWAIDSQRKNIGDTIQLTITAKRKGTNTLAPNTRISFAAVNVVNRQNAAVTSGELVLNGSAISAYQGVTNGSGQLAIAVTDPAGTGVKTTLQAKSENGDSENQDVIFNVITSPDTASANMWGHMTDALTANGMTFRRPYLTSEKAGSSKYEENNESWSTYSYVDATAMCTVATESQMTQFYQAYPAGGINTQHGWPILSVYRTSTRDVGGQHLYIYMSTGRTAYSANSDNLYYKVSCKL
jgi:adhesin/invasin